mmetsp:Transcript_95809/g.276736  ORF Transcript_95809/g.276736 Transcript_95809/m.276736 type:complete len:248 (-) Transcript_95809:194-937(-)
MRKALTMSSPNSSAPMLSPTPFKPCLANNAAHQRRQASSGTVDLSGGRLACKLIPGGAEEATALARVNSGSMAWIASQCTRTSQPMNCDSKCRQAASAVPGYGKTAAYKSKSTSSGTAKGPRSPASAAACCAGGNIGGLPGGLGVNGALRSRTAPRIIAEACSSRCHNCCAVLAMQGARGGSNTDAARPCEGVRTGVTTAPKGSCPDMAEVGANVLLNIEVCNAGSDNAEQAPQQLADGAVANTYGA